MTPRRSRTSSTDSGISDLLAKFRDFFKGESTSWGKVAVGVLTILIALWGYFGFNGRINDNDRRLDRLSARIQVLERVDKKLTKLQHEASDLTEVLERIRTAIGRTTVDSLIDICKRSPGANRSPFCKGLLHDLGHA